MVLRNTGLSRGLAPTSNHILIKCAGFVVEDSSLTLQKPQSLAQSDDFWQYLVVQLT